jgi:phosphoenolpyruvate-protein kinase (PTS system EI component)
VIIDAGSRSDKVMSALNLPEELNPFPDGGRFASCLERLDIFKTQLLGRSSAPAR